MDGGTPMVIDLDLSPDESPTVAVPGSPVSARRLRFGALAVGAVLLLALGGSAAPGPPSLTEIATLTVAPDRGFVLTPDRLFVGTNQTGESVAAYEPRQGRLLWTAEYDRDDGAAGVLGRQVADVLLIWTVRDEAAGTTAVDARTGEVRWSVPGEMQTMIDDRTGLTMEEVFPADAKPVEPSAALSASYYYSASGDAYLVEPLGTVVRAYDLGSGEALWSSVPVANATATRWSNTPLAESAAVVVTTVNGQVEQWDARTGKARQSLPAVTVEPPAVVVAGDLLLVQRADGVLTAYAVDTFTERWHRVLGSPEVSVNSCADQPCVGNGSGWTLLDPGTGKQTGPKTDPTTVRVSVGSHVVELRMEDGDLARTVDPATDRTLTDLTGWEGMTTPPPGEPALLTQTSRTGAGTWFGLLEPGATEVHLLGMVPYQAEHCQIEADIIVCQDQSDALRIWRYHR
ncbi:PQQ-binding-like beta-propeller repeat protein [Micromonospora sp. NPDC049523]|uniref:outer membrane protein assembly factor BamB family protein n=1 Tax=Micromonospora sp. NPDC049523 TaxID=3155921 RepID=UPI0034374D07